MFWEKILWEGNSPYNGKIKVIEFGRVRRLVAEGHTQSRTLSEDGKTHHYWDTFAANLPELSQNSRILILGLGAGTVAKILSNKLGQVAIHGVEIDPLMVELGKRYFYLNEPNIEIFVEDAKKFVDRASGKYDAIFVDLFYKDKASDLMMNEDFLRKTRSLLDRNGVVIVNKICRDKIEDNEFVERMRGIFESVVVARERGDKYEQNVIVYGRI